MLTKEYLKNVLNYDSETGLFTWRKRVRNNVHIGDICGWTHHEGYILIGLLGKSFGAHRLAWLYSYGVWPDHIDHINGNRTDNRISNLRACSKGDNNKNAKIRKDNTSGIKGVSWDKQSGKWSVNISNNGRQIKVGRFDDIELAELVAKEARNRLHGAFARDK